MTYWLASEYFVHLTILINFQLLCPHVFSLILMDSQPYLTLSLWCQHLSPSDLLSLGSDVPGGNLGCSWNLGCSLLTDGWSPPSLSVMVRHGMGRENPIKDKEQGSPVSRIWDTFKQLVH